MRTRTKWSDPKDYYHRANYKPLTGSSTNTAEYDVVEWGVVEVHHSGSQISDIAGNGRWDKPCAHFKFSGNQPGYRRATYVHDPISGIPTQYLALVEAFTPEQIRGFASLCPVLMPNPSVADVWDRLANPFGNSGTETLLGLGEIRGLVSSVRSRLNFLRNIPKKLRALPRSLKNSKSRRDMLRGISKDTLSSYLEYEFAWEQTGEDIARILAFVSSVEDHVRKMVENQGKIQRMGFKRTKSGNFSTDNETTVTYQSVSRIVYKFTYQYTYSGFSGLTVDGSKQRNAVAALTAMSEFWGIERSAGEAWAIFPGSWVIDQLVPVGDFLDDLGSVGYYGVGHSMSFAGSTSSTSVTGKVTRSKPPVPSNVYGTWSMGGVKISASFSLYNRSVSFSPPPMLSVRPRSKGPSNTAKAYAALRVL